jgi:hypothetical protein
MWSVIHLHSTIIRGDFRTSASGSSGSGVRAMRRGSSAAIVQVTRHARMPATCGCPPSADARLARMPADADARPVRMLAMIGFAESGRPTRLVRKSTQEHSRLRARKQSERAFVATRE